MQCLYYVQKHIVYYQREYKLESLDNIFNDLLKKLRKFSILMRAYLNSQENQ